MNIFKRAAQAGEGASGEVKVDFNDLTRGPVDSSVLFLRDGHLMMRETGDLYPKEGGTRRGGFTAETDLTAHFEAIIRRVLAEKADVP